MASKRRLPSLGLERRVRVRREETWEPEPESEEPPSSDDGASAGDDGDDSPSSAPASEPGSDSDESDDGGDGGDDAAPPPVDLSAISFGALARAQASLPSTRRAKRPRADSAADAADTEPRPAARAGQRRDTQPAPKRASKHAPQELSSKRPVPRGRRDIVAADAAARSRTPRDPRFDPLVAGRDAPDDARARRAYAFLDDYRDSEMAALRAQLARTRDPAARDALARQLASMEDRRRARDRRDEELRLLREHRRHEKDLVARGKKPFYLKKSEQKKQLLTRRFEGMTKGQVDRAIERKRKKVAGKERKELDSLQRVRDRH